MSDISNIIEFYKITTTLKDTIRTGWKYWNVKKERLESIAEHVYGTCMLAIAIWSESAPDIDICKVMMMLALHETEETIIGDMTPYDEGYDKKYIKGHEAVAKVFENMAQRDRCVALIEEFDEKATPEALFAYKIDKLECDFQAKRYDDLGQTSLDNAEDIIKFSPSIQNLKNNGAERTSDFFILTDKRHYRLGLNDGEEDIFTRLADYLLNNKVFD